jgi:hypothetical protein
MTRFTAIRIFLSLAAAAAAFRQTASVTFLGLDVSTQGNWKSLDCDDRQFLLVHR